jgi:hypothetical protein
VNEVLMQSLIWIGAASLLVLYVKRRRKRKMLP